MKTVYFMSSLWVLSLTGCVTKAERDYQAAQKRHFDLLDVRAQMQQRAYRAFPEVFHRMQAAYLSGQHVVIPKLSKSVAPRYPYGKTRGNLQGGVWIALAVNESGDVSAVRALQDEQIKETPAFIEAAAVAVRQWKFAPATVGGKPMPFILCVPIGFELKNGL